MSLVAVSLVAEAADALAIAIGNVATMLDLNRIVLGGGIIDKLGRPFLDQIEQSATFGGLGPQLCELVLASRLDDAGVLGAALLADRATGGRRGCQLAVLWPVRWPRRLVPRPSRCR